MEYKVPRIVLAGTGSGCGKTTVTCAILQALVNRGKNVGACKCGPDYIDPMFHSTVIGVKSANLDSFFFSNNTLKYLLAKGGQGRDITVIEGVMGFYDGMSMSDAAASTYEIACITQSPVVLVINARGASASVLAEIHGFLTFYPDNPICGVILNQCTAMTYKMLSEQIRKRFGGKVCPVGYMPVVHECTLESRHLGLITAVEVTDLKQKLDKLAATAEETIDFNAITALAESAPRISCEAVVLPKYKEHIRVGLARDNAFCFYYNDSLEALREMGAELIEFSPLSDSSLPLDIDGLYLGGGYPELYADKLCANSSMLESVKHALENGLPCIAECGGFMYLTERIGEYPMVGYLRGRCFDTGKLTRFGYVTLKSKSNNMLCRQGGEIRAHEFHHWDCENSGNDFTAFKQSGKSWDCIVAKDLLYAGFPHFHFYANMGVATEFYETCLKEKHSHD